MKALAILILNSLLKKARPIPRIESLTLWIPKNTTNVIKSFKNGPSKHIYCINFWKIQICNRLEFFANQGISTEHLMRQRRAAEMSGTRKISWKFSLNFDRQLAKHPILLVTKLLGKSDICFEPELKIENLFVYFNQRSRHYN